MLKKIWLDIKIFFNYFFAGLRAADNEMSTGSKQNADGVAIEQKKQQDNVYAALLRGEVTQEVREMRHEMYYAERKSKNYVYSGGGHAVKKKSMFEYEGNVENSDGHRVVIVQDNYQDQASIEDYGIDVGKVKEFGSKIYSTIKMEDIAKREYTLTFERDFIPKFKLEMFAKKLVIKEFDGKYILDVYFSKYSKEFDRISRMFTNAIEALYQGDAKSEIIDFRRLYFISRNAYGTDDLKFYSFINFEFVDIIDFDGNYVLRFVCEADNFGEDLIEEFYDERTAEKSANHERRENVSLSLEDAAEIAARESYDADTAQNLINELNEGIGSEVSGVDQEVQPE